MVDTPENGRTAEKNGRFGPAGLVWRMVLRSKLRFYAFSLLLTVIALLLAGVSLLGQGVEDAVARGSGRLGADLMVIPAGAEVPLNAALIGGLPMKRLLPAGVAESVAALAEVDLAAPQYFLSSAPASCCEAGNLLLIGFDPSRDFTVLPWLPKSLPPLRESEELLAGGGVMKGRGAAFRLYNRTFRVAARLEKSGIGYFDNALFIPLAGVAEMEKGSRSRGAVRLDLLWERPSLLLLKLSPGADPQKTAADIEKSFPAVRVMTIPELFRKEQAKMAQLAAAGRPMRLAGWLLALSAGGAIQLLYWRERRPTLGLLQACGYGKRELPLLFTLETLLLALGAMVAGSAAAFLLLQFFAPNLTAAFGLPLFIGAGSAATAGIPWLCLSFAVGMAAETLLIIVFLLRHEPADLMRGV